MNYAVLLLLLLFSVTFGFSALEKITDWKGNKAFLKSYFKETWVPPFVPIIMGVLLVIELLATVIGVFAMFEIIQDKCTAIFTIRWFAILFSFANPSNWPAYSEDYDGH